MKKVFEVSLSKTYKIQISANSNEEAKRLSEFYTGDISDISNEKERNNENFRIEAIECVTNDAFECIEIIK